MPLLGLRRITAFCKKMLDISSKTGDFIYVLIDMNIGPFEYFYCVLIIWSLRIAPENIFHKFRSRYGPLWPNPSLTFRLLMKVNLSLSPMMLFIRSG